jgi:hypothetical protein
MVIRLVIDYGELVKVALRKVGVGKGVGGWVESYGGCWVLWPCVGGCISVVVVRVFVCQGLQWAGVVCSLVE